MERVQIKVDKSVPSELADFYSRRALRKAESYLEHYDNMMIDNGDDFVKVGPKVKHLDIYMICRNREVYISFNYEGVIRCLIDKEDKEMRSNVITTGSFSVILPLIKKGEE